MGYLCLLLFWTGVAVMRCKPVRRYELKSRAEAFRGKLAERTEKNGLLMLLERLKNGRKRKQLSSELADCLSYIKNIVILGRENGVSTQMLLEELSDFSEKLRPVFLEMARYINVNDKVSAAECLKNAVGSGPSADIGRFLAGWEDIPPSDILDTVVLYQDTLRQERLTQQRKKDEIISDVVYLPVVINCMVVLLNFIYVAYFIEQQDALSILF